MKLPIKSVPAWYKSFERKKNGFELSPGIYCHVSDVCVCVCVCSRKGRQSGTSVNFSPDNWVYFSHRAYARVFRVVKTMQNAPSI